MKKLKLLFTALLLLCCVGTATAHDFEVDGIYYNITNDTNKTVEVTYIGYYYDSYNNEYTGSVVIPESVTYNGSTYSVTSIGSSAFYYCTGLTSVVIGNSVTNIGGDAFRGCTGLTSITIPNSVTSIGSKAFRGCSGLTSIEIPNSVTSIGSEAFRGCSGLTSIEIPNSVTSIGNGAFNGTPWYDDQLDGVVYAGKVLYEYKGTMPENTSITIKDGTLGIAGGAFDGCTGLTSVVIPNSVTSIGYRAFYNCSGLKSITIPNSVTSIGSEAFRGCTELTSVVIGNSVTSIGYQAFYYCSELTSITIPNSVTSIGNGAFNGTPWYDDQPDGVVYAGKVLYEYKGTMPLNTSVTVKDGTLGIADYAFNGCTGLRSITIPNSVTSIGYQAFFNCSGLKSITIPNSVTSIGNSAFRDCTGLRSITIPNSVTSIENGAFEGCTGLTSVEIGDGVTSIGEYAFASCYGLTSITIPNSVKSISDYAFYGCTGLNTVYNFSNQTFYKGSRSDGFVAYYADKVYNAPNGFIDGDFIWYENGDGMTLAGYLGNATELALPADYNGKSVTSIGDEVFRGCTGLTRITIPNSVTNIGEYAFAYCDGLTSIEIPNSVTSIGEKAFNGCTGLKTVYNFSNLTFSKGSSYNGYVAYYADKVYNAPNGFIDGDFIWSENEDGMTLAGYLGNATELTLPADYKGKSVTSIGDDAFRGCTGFTSITIPNSVTSIGASAFEGCNNIEKLYIGSSVESIGDKAFAGCEKITEIKVALEKPIRGSADIFTNAVYDNATLYIPNDTEQLYQKREPWNLFFYIAEMDFTGIDEVFDEVKAESGTNGRRPEGLKAKIKTVYDLNGRKVVTPKKGLYIIDGKKVLIK